MRKWSFVVAVIAAMSGWLAWAGPVTAGHVASNQCGVQSSSFARTCRPGAHKSCLGAVARGVAGFTADLCERRKAACSKCLGDIHVCISRIGHWPALTHTCDTCKTRFKLCYEALYPKS